MQLCSSCCCKIGKIHLSFSIKIAEQESVRIIHYFDCCFDGVDDLSAILAAIITSDCSGNLESEGGEATQLLTVMLLIALD